MLRSNFNTNSAAKVLLMEVIRPLKGKGLVQLGVWTALLEWDGKKDWKAHITYWPQQSTILS